MPRRLTVYIERVDWATLVGEAVRTLPLETGGIVMGRWLDSTAARITDVIGPGPDAKHEPRSFDPDQDWQESEVARIWTSRAGDVEYLGDWHTHPDGRAYPSRGDSKAAELIASSSEAGAERPIIMIVAVSPKGSMKARVHVWIGKRFSRARLVVRWT